jgi:hypothetical protein
VSSPSWHRYVCTTTCHAGHVDIPERASLFAFAPLERAWTFAFELDLACVSIVGIAEKVRKKFFLKHCYVLRSHRTDPQGTTVRRVWAARGRERVRSRQLRPERRSAERLSVWSHNPKVAGSNPAPATITGPRLPNRSHSPSATYVPSACGSMRALSTCWASLALAICGDFASSSGISATWLGHEGPDFLSRKCSLSLLGGRKFPHF